jgi:LysM repeat protein
MTRETKIGLLVGLAFIIIVGILLSEPLNHAGEAQPAPLPFAGGNVLRSDAAPGATAAQPQVSLAPEHPAAPSNPVLTHEEVARPQGGISIQIGSGQAPAARVDSLSNAGGHSPIASNEQQTQTAPQKHQTATPKRDNLQTTQGNQPPSAPDNQTAVAQNHRDPIMDAAAQQGEEIVPVGNGGSQSPQNTKAQANSGPAKSYEAVSGDSLAKIAQKMYGSSSKAYRDAIVAANPSLKADPNKVLIGQAYVIPTVTAGSANNATPAVVKETPATPAPNKTESAEYWYTVKPGDSLWAIARDQLGDTATVAAIKDLNAKTLNGSDGVKAGMKLRLPTKPLASASE